MLHLGNNSENKKCLRAIIIAETWLKVNAFHEIYGWTVSQVTYQRGFTQKNAAPCGTAFSFIIRECVC